MIGIDPKEAKVALEKEALIEEETAQKIKDLLCVTLKNWGPLFPKFKIGTCFFNQSDVFQIEIDAIKVDEMPTYTLILRPSGLLYIVFDENGKTLVHRAQEASPRMYMEFARKAVLAAAYGHARVNQESK